MVHVQYRLQKKSPISTVHIWRVCLLIYVIRNKWYYSFWSSFLIFTLKITSWKSIITLISMHISNQYIVLSLVLLRKQRDVKAHLSVCPSVTQTLTWLISFEVLMIEHLYLELMILVISDFSLHYCVTLTLTFNLLQTSKLVAAQVNTDLQFCLFLLSYFCLAHMYILWANA